MFGFTYAVKEETDIKRKVSVTNGSSLVVDYLIIMLYYAACF